MRALDAAALAAGTAIETLIARAGWAVAAAAARLLGSAYGRRIVVVCGTGNNGADGVAAGRVLAQWGAAVELISISDEPPATPPGRGIRVGGLTQLHDALDRADLVIDAIFGVGLSRDVEATVATAILAINGSGVPVLAIDVPSGIDADNGRVRGHAIEAFATVTFGGIKPGLRFPPGSEHAGRVEIADIGLPSRNPPDLPIAALDAEDVASLWPRRSATQHKRNAGTVMLVAGSESMPGAAVLAARAAVAAGAGLLYVAAPRSVLPMVIAGCPEAIAVPYDAPFLDANWAHELFAFSGRIDTLAIGPGLGREIGTLAAVRTLLDHLDVPAIVDADALHAVAIASRTAPTIVTPHAGEWSVIVEADAAEVARDRLAAAARLVEALSHRIRRVIGVLKGPGTLITDGTSTYLDLAGGPELAQGGSGDVLSGLLAALCARTARADRVVDAATVAAGVWVHSRAGALAAGRHGGQEPAGASRIADAIPEAIAEGLRGAAR